jgi:DmsE family decaheme c-type cytochrome
MARARWSPALFLALCALLVGARAPSAAPAATYVGSEACAQCHEDLVKAYAANPHTRAERDAQLVADRTGCESCHGPGSLHVAAGGDKSDPGWATIRNFKNTPAAEATAVCTTCHRTGEQFYWDQSTHARHDVTCINCHSVHSSRDLDHSRLLKTADVNSQCLTCHKNRRMMLARSAHMPLTEGGMNCASCHNPHGSPTPHMVRGESNNDLCLSCHADKRGPFLWEHAPVRENCLNCHQPHGGNNDKLLGAKRPFLCQRCHIGTRHPSTLYEGSDLATNRLMNRSCTNCHTQIHGSNHPSGNFFLR